MVNLPTFPMQYMPVASNRQIFGLKMPHIEAVHQLYQSTVPVKSTEWRSSERLSEVPAIDLRTIVGQPNLAQVDQQALLLRSSLGKFAVAVERIYPTRIAEQENYYAVPRLLQIPLFSGIVEDLDTLIFMIDVDKLAEMIKTQEPEWIVGEVQT